MGKEKLSHVRASLGLSQQALADLAGLSKSTISDAERDRSIRLLTAYAILNALNGMRTQRGQSELMIDSLDWSVDES